MVNQLLALCKIAPHATAQSVMPMITQAINLEQLINQVNQQELTIVPSTTASADNEKRSIIRSYYVLEC